MPCDASLCDYVANVLRTFCSIDGAFKNALASKRFYSWFRMRENPVFSRVLKNFVQEKTVEK